MIDIYGEALKITNDCENLWSEDWAQAIISLVTRAVAEAKMKQMATFRSVWELLESSPELNPSNYNHDDVCELNAKVIEAVLAIRTAVAATEPRDAGKDDARELGLDGDA